MSDSVQPHRWKPTRLPRPWDSPGKNTGVGCHFLLQRMKVKSESEVAQSCLPLSDPIYCSLPGSSIHGIFQARVLEWVTSAFSVKWLQPLYITLQQFLKRTSLQFSVNPQIPLLHQYPKACEYTYSHACTPLFRAPLFRRAQR